MSNRTESASKLNLRCLTDEFFNMMHVPNESECNVTFLEQLRTEHMVKKSYEDFTDRLNFDSE